MGVVDYVSVGCLAIDNIIGTNGEKRLKVFGGNAAFGAAGIGLWHDGRVGVVSRRGTDLPMAWIETLRAHGIDTRGIHDVPMRHMMFSGMVYDETGDRHEVTFNEDGQSAELIEGFPEMTPEMVTLAHENFAPTGDDIPDEYLGADVAIAARHYDRQMAYATRFREGRPDCLLVLDTGLQYMKPECIDLLPPLFEKVDVVIPSEAEARQLFGDVRPSEMLRGLERLGAKHAAVKLGKRGCLVDSGDGLALVGAYHSGSAVKDPSGAGDSFCGGFLVGLRRTGDLVEAAKYGAVSSSFVIEDFGADYALDVRAEDAEARLSHIAVSTYND